MRHLIKLPYLYFSFHSQIFAQTLQTEICKGDMSFLEVNIIISNANGVVSTIAISQGGFRLKVGDKF